MTTERCPPIKARNMYLNGEASNSATLVGVTVAVYLPSFKNRFGDTHRHHIRWQEEKAQMKRTMDAVLNKDDGNPG